MKFQPYHYQHIDSLLRHYAVSLERPDIIGILDNGIKSKSDAVSFCEFIPDLLDQRLADEKAGKKPPIDIGSAVISDLHYEAGSFVCDAGYEAIWDEMIEGL